MQARVFIFGMQVDNDVLYHGIANQPSPAYSSLYLSDLLSYHTLNDEIFVKGFSEAVQARVFIFGMQVDNDVLYRGIANQPTPAYSSLYLSIFLSLYIFCHRYLHSWTFINLCVCFFPFRFCWSCAGINYIVELN